MLFPITLIVLSGALATLPSEPVVEGSTTGLTPTSSISTSSSATSTSSGSSATSSVDWSNLLGRDNRPVVDHVADTEDTSNDSRRGNPATVLLGLTKCNPDGEWITIGIEYQMNDLLRILTGEEVTTLSGSDLNQDNLWNDVFSKADFTPILIKWENAWSVVMTQDVRNGENWLGWADPYGAHTIKKDANNDPDGRLNTFTKYDTFAPITEVLHLKDFTALSPKPVGD